MAQHSDSDVVVLVLCILFSLLSDERDYVSDTIGIHSQSSPPRLEDTPHSYKWVPHQSHFLPRYIMCLHSDHARARDPVTIIQEKVYNYRYFKSAKHGRHKTGNFLNGVWSELFRCCWHQQAAKHVSVCLLVRPFQSCLKR